MTTKIPVYAHILGEGLFIFRTNGKRIISEPAIPAVTGLLGYIIAPDRTLVWKGDNGIDIYQTAETFDAAADGKTTARMDGPPFYRGYERGRVLPKSFDLAVAVYYAERNMHDLAWEPAISTSCSRSIDYPREALRPGLQDQARSPADGRSAPRMAAAAH